MEATAENRDRLRALVDEPVPAGGSQYDTRFTDDQLDALLAGAYSVEGAAADGWMRKGGMLLNEMDGIESERQGQETYSYASLKSQLAYTREMADYYRQQDIAGRGAGVGRMLSVEEPEVC